MTGALAAEADLPIFMIHGVNDNAARIPAADWFFHDREPRATDKVWIGQWDHGSAGATTCSEGHVNFRFDQWQYALHAWFDHHLKGMDVAIGPALEAFHNGERVTTGTAWDPAPGRLTLYPNATDGTLSTTVPEEDATTSFRSLAGDGSVEFTSEPFDETTVLQGVPELDLAASVTGQVVHLVTTLWVEDANGDRRAANFCAINTHLRDDVTSPSPVIPGQNMDLEPGCFTQTHTVDAGERLVFEVGTSSQHHVPSFAHDAQITVHTGPEATRYALLLLADAELFDDEVPLRLGEKRDGDDDATEPVRGPAQAPVFDLVAWEMSVAADELPQRRHDGDGQRDLDRVTGQERHDPERDGLLGRAEEHAKPHGAEGVDDEVADDHRRDRGRHGADPATRRPRAEQRSGDREPDDVADGRAGRGREQRHAGHPEREEEARPDRGPLRPQRDGAGQDHQGLGGDRDRVAGQEEGQLRRRGDREREPDRQQHVTDALAGKDIGQDGGLGRVGSAAHVELLTGGGRGPCPGRQAR